MKNLIILAVIVLAVWFVFFRKNKANVKAMSADSTSETKEELPTEIIGRNDYVRPRPNLIIQDAIAGTLSHLNDNLNVS